MPVEMVKEVRDLGLLSGIEFTTPRKVIVRTMYETFRKVYPAMFGQIIVMKIPREKHAVVRAIGEVVQVADSSPAFWTEALGLARRAANI